MHDLFYLAFRIISLILPDLPQCLLTNQILGWMKGLQPCLKVTLNFKKVRTIVQLLLPLRNTCLNQQQGSKYQLSLLIEPLHYIIVDCFYSGNALTWLQFTLLSVHLLACWLLLGDYDFAVHHETLYLSKKKVENDDICFDKDEYENRRIYYNESCYIILVFLKRHVVPQLIPIIKMLEERFEYTLQELKDALIRIRSHTNYICANNNNLLKDMHKPLKRKQGRHARMNDRHKEKTYNAVFFGACFIQPKLYLTKHRSNAAQMRHRANVFSFTFRKILDWLASDPLTSDYVHLAPCGGVYIGELPPKINETYVYCLPNCQKCQLHHSRTIVNNTTDVIDASVTKWNRAVAKQTDEAKRIKNDTKRLKEYDRLNSFYKTEQVGYMRYLHCVVWRKVLKIKRNNKHNHGSEANVVAMHQKYLKRYVQTQMHTQKKASKKQTQSMHFQNIVGKHTVTKKNWKQSKQTRDQPQTTPFVLLNLALQK